MFKNLAISLILCTFVGINQALRNTVKRVDMKRVFMMMMALMLSLTMFAQQKDVTRFLGIPVDGTVATMKQKLLNKGFKQSPYNKNQLEGRFNNSDVYVHIIENKGKVWRISVGDKNFMDETNIRIRFNNLVRQFAKNKKYFPVKNIEEYIIPDDTDISYEMSVRKKRFEADFFQMPSDSMTIMNASKQSLLAKYTYEQISNPTPEQQKDMEQILNETAEEVLSQRMVWFMINENYGQYSIMIHYENEYNQDDGEDL